MGMTALCRSRRFLVLLVPLVDIRASCSDSLLIVWEQLPEVKEIYPIIYPLHPVADDVQNLSGLTVQEKAAF